MFQFSGVHDGVLAAYVTLVAVQGITPDAWLQYGSLGVLALYIFLHWIERRDQRRRMEPAFQELNKTLAGLWVLIDERLPRRTD